MSYNSQMGKLMFFNFICASTYTSSQAVIEAVRRGATEEFCKPCGFLSYSVKGSEQLSKDLNGVLITPSLILTVKHGLVDPETKNPLELAMGIFILNPNVTKACLLSDEDKRRVLQAASVDCSITYPHPDPNVDLCILRLKKPINNIAILPLLDSAQEQWVNGVLVSFAPPKIMDPKIPIPSVPEIFSPNDQARHIAILHIDSVMDFLDAVYLTTSFLMHKTHKTFLYPKDAVVHRLNAFSNPSDSGAPFIVKIAGQYYVAGLHKGKVVVRGEEMPDKDYEPAFSLIIPVYAYIEWIQSIICQA